MSAYDVASPTPHDEQQESNAQKEKILRLALLKDIVSTSGSKGYEVYSLTKEGFALATIKQDILSSPKIAALREKSPALFQSSVWDVLVEKVQGSIDSRKGPRATEEDYYSNPTETEKLLNQIAHDIVELFNGNTTHFSSSDKPEWIDQHSYARMSDKVQRIYGRATQGTESHGEELVDQVETRPTQEELENPAIAEQVASDYLQSYEVELAEDRAYEQAYFDGVFGNLELSNDELPATNNVTVLVLPGVGRNSQSEDVRACVDHLMSKKIDALAIDWPKFESYHQLALWLKTHIDELKAMGKIKEKIIIYGHSKGGLAARHFADLYPDAAESYIESGVPACSEDDPRPTALEDKLQAVLDAPAVPWVMGLIAKTGIASKNELHQYILEHPDEAAKMYLDHIRNGKAWDTMAKRFPASKMMFSYHRKGDGAVNYVGRGSVHKIPFAVVLESDAKGHKMLPPLAVENMVLYSLARAEKRKDVFDPARLIFEDEAT